MSSVLVASMAQVNGACYVARISCGLKTDMYNWIVRAHEIASQACTVNAKLYIPHNYRVESVNFAQKANVLFPFSSQI